MLRRGRSPTQDIVQDARDYLGNGSSGGGDGGGMSAIGGGGGSNGRNNSSRVQGPKPTPVLTMPVPRRGTRSASNTPLSDMNVLGTPSATTGTPTSAVTGSYLEQFERKRRKEEMYDLLLSVGKVAEYESSFIKKDILTLGRSIGTYK